MSQRERKTKLKTVSMTEKNCVRDREKLFQVLRTMQLEQICVNQGEKQCQ